MLTIVAFTTVTSAESLSICGHLMSVADDSAVKTEHSKTSRAVCYRGVWKASIYATVSEVQLSQSAT